MRITVLPGGNSIDKFNWSIGDHIRQIVFLILKSKFSFITVDIECVIVESWIVNESVPIIPSSIISFFTETISSTYQEARNFHRIHSDTFRNMQLNIPPSVHKLRSFVARERIWIIPLDTVLGPYSTSTLALNNYCCSCAHCDCGRRVLIGITVDDWVLIILPVRMEDREGQQIGVVEYPNSETPLSFSNRT